MTSRDSRLSVVLAIGVALWGGVAAGQPVNAVLSSPTIDRWMYGFNQAFPLGSEAEASVFSSVGSVYQPDFDNRDGQMLLVWDTGVLVPSGAPTDQYRVLAARVVVRTSRDLSFRYDPTRDPVACFYLPSDPNFTPDLDPGAQPIELFGVGYRNGFTAQTFAENSPHSPGPAFPNKRVRNAFAAVFDAQANPIDVSNCVDDRFDAAPWAIGTAGLGTGDLVPINTDFAFTIDPDVSAVAAYLRRGLSAGRVSLMVTSLALTDQQSSQVPAFYTKEFPAAIGGVPARLELTVCVGPRADWDCNGQVQPADVAAFVNTWFTDLLAGTRHADFDGDGSVQPGDVASFIGVWFGELSP